MLATADYTGLDAKIATASIPQGYYFP